MNYSPLERRGTYFLFQGLLTSVLLLLVLFQHPAKAGDTLQICALAAVLAASLAAIKLAPADLLTRWWAQTGLFVFDAAITAVALAWTQARSEFFLLYVLILLGTALTRNTAQSVALGIVIILLYLLSGWRSSSGWPQESGFWLQFDFLCIMTSLMAILSRDTQLAQQEQERHYYERTVQYERLATLGQIAGEVAHRIKSPLTTILVNAEVLSYRRKSSQKNREEISQIQEAARHCQEILKNLLDLGRIEEMSPAPLDLRKPLESALNAVRPQIQQKGIHLEVRGLDAPRMVLGDSSLLHEAIAAVLQNAVDSTPKGKKHIRVSLEVRDRRRWWHRRKSTPTYAVAIEDEGSGINPKNVERIFQPFFTTKGAQGSGLGLSAALRIIQRHQGTIEAFSHGPGLGAKLTLILPALSRGFRPGKV